MNGIDVGPWNSNWVGSLPLIVLNVVLHAIGLGFVNEAVVRVLSDAMAGRTVGERLSTKTAGGRRALGSRARATQA